MSLNNIRQWWYLFVILMVCTPHGHVWASQHALTLDLTMQCFEPASQELLVRFAATNTSQKPLTLPRLTAELWQDHLGWWGGWGLSVSRCFPLGGSPQLRHPDPRQDELMTLEPGEQVAFTFNLALLLSIRGQFVIKDDEFTKSVFAHTFPLSLQDGEHTAYARVFWDGQEMGRSEPLTFTILQNPRRMYFPSETTILISPDERRSIINVREDTNAPFSGGTLHIREHRSGQEKQIYTYKERVEVIWSPEGHHLLINNYSCARRPGYFVDPVYKTHSLVFNVERHKLVDVKDLLQHQLKKNFYQHLGDSRGVKWLDEHRLEIKIRVSLIGIEKPRDARQRYEYNLLTGDFRRLDDDEEGIK